MEPMILHPAARYPADPRAVFILAASVFSGLGALGLHSQPQALNQLLPSWGVALWGVLLVLGSTLTLVGMAFQTVNGIIVEQIGSIVVGSTVLYYCGLAIYFLGVDVLAPLGIIFAWGVSCFLRWAQLQLLLKRAHRQVLEDRWTQWKRDNA